MRRGDDQHEVFARWMDDHRGIVVKIARSFTATTADRDDLIQEIAIALWRSIPSYRAESRESTWIWRVALNRAISWQRASGVDQSSLDDVAEPAAVERAEDRLALGMLYDAIRSLRPIDRSLMVLSLEGHSYAEMADITGLSESNVGARLTRARTRLTQLMNTEEA